MIKLIRVYNVYGKGDGEECTEQFLINDTVENRQDLIYNFMFGDVIGYD